MLFIVLEWHFFQEIRKWNNLWLWHAGNILIHVAEKFVLWQGFYFPCFFKCYRHSLYSVVLLNDITVNYICVCVYIYIYIYRKSVYWFFRGVLQGSIRRSRARYIYVCIRYEKRAKCIVELYQHLGILRTRAKCGEARAEGVCFLCFSSDLNSQVPI